MLVALITDTHAGVRNDSLPFLNNFKTSLDNFFFPYLKEHGINRVVHLGDVADRRKYCNINTAYRLRNDFLNPLEQMGVQMDLIAGNHDEYYKNTNEVNFLTEVIEGRYPNFKVHINASEIEIDGLPILLLPWICDTNYDDTVSKIQATKAQVAFGHLELPGFEMFRGAISDHGLDRTLLDKFDIVCSGHYHHRSTDGTVTYIGAFSEFIWSDYNDPRGFTVFNTETRNMEFIQNPNVMFKKVFYDDSGIDNSSILDFDESDYSGKVVKIIVKNKTNPNMFDLFIDKMEHCGTAEIQTVEDHLNLDQESEEHIVDEAEDTDVIIKQYIDSLKLNNINKPKLENVIADLYKEAKEVE